MADITSVKNPLVRDLRALKDRRAREEAGQFLVEGEKLLREALACGLAPGAALLEAGREGEFYELARLLAAAGAQVHFAPRHVLEAVCDTKTPQGACCAFALPPGWDLAVAPDRIAALDGVQDPGNLGAIWRTADAAGFGALLLGAGCADRYGPKAQRAAMGSGFRLPSLVAPDLAAALMDLRARGYQIVISALDGAPFYRRPALGERFVLVIGSEARGVGEAVARAANLRLKLPMRGGAESLNAAVAAGIMMYELCRDLGD